jgi:hypothetical protein
MQINESKIAFIVFHLFFQKGTFQCVTADSNKKIAFLSSSRRRLCSTPPSNALHRLAPIRFTRPPTATVYHDIPFFQPNCYNSAGRDAVLKLWSEACALASITPCGAWLDSRASRSPATGLDAGNPGLADFYDAIEG